jgi:hypothetical protein
LDDTTSTTGSSTPSSPSSHGEIVSSLSSGFEALKTSAPPTPPPAPTPAASPNTPAAPPAATPGSSDQTALPPTPAAADPDAELLSTPVVGPIPPDRHKKILERTRQKVAEETRVAFEKEHGPWLQLKSQFTPDEFSTLMPTLKNLASNPMQFMHDTAREMGMQLVPIGQAQNGARPSAPPPSPAPAQEPQPDIAVQLENGQIAHTYSAEQQRLRDQWILSQVEGRLGKELEPFREAQKQQEYQAFLGHIDGKARADFAEVSQNEAFEELKPHIAAIMKSDKRYSLEKAYNRAYREQYLPTRDAKIEQRLLDQQTQKARAANSSLTPTRRTTAESGSTAPTSTADILRQKAAELGVTL